MPRKHAGQDVVVGDAEDAQEADGQIGDRAVIDVRGRLDEREQRAGIRGAHHHDEDGDQEGQGDRRSNGFGKLSPGRAP